jgi:hypothetical protein
MLRTAIRRNEAVNVNAQALRTRTNNIVQTWFREVRPYLDSGGVPADRVKVADVAMQNLLKLALGNNSKKSYISEIDAVREAWPELMLDVEQYRAQSIRSAAESEIRMTEVEQRILDTLPKIGLPHAVPSYQQVIIDLAEANKLSYRGTATELREVVREVLDHLAPDEDVLAAPGFKLVDDQKRPTMAQKARFILKARGVGETAREAPEKAVELLEEQIASIARATYQKGSASTHAATNLETVRGFKGYADAVLAELLQVHRPAT